METKTCKKCNQTKSILDFYKFKGNYRGTCKSCHTALMNVRVRKWQINNPEKAKKHRKKYYQNLPYESIIFNCTKSRAKRNKIPFNIDITDIIIPEFCPVLGIKLERATGQPSDNSPSLDKLIPELGYIKGNVRIISWRANTLKRDAKTYELELVIKYMKDNNCN